METSLALAVEAILADQGAVAILFEKVDLVELVGKVSQADLVQAVVYSEAYQVDLETDQVLDRAEENLAALTFLVEA